jgi:hypothetical protein
MIDTTKPVDRTGNAYCGPLVVAAILGCSTGKVAEEIAAYRVKNKGVRLPSGLVRRMKGRSADKIRGTHSAELLELLARHGIKTEAINPGARLIPWERNVMVNSQFTRWVRKAPVLSTDDWVPASLVRLTGLTLWQASSKFAEGTFIIVTPGHWAIISDGKWCETFTGGKWVDLRHAPKDNRRVISAWRVTK